MSIRLSLGDGKLAIRLWATRRCNASPSLEAINGRKADLHRQTLHLRFGPGLTTGTWFRRGGMGGVLSHSRPHHHHILNRYISFSFWRDPPLHSARCYDRSCCYSPLRSLNAIDLFYITVLLGNYAALQQ